jgi:hypothetical protein
LTCIKVAPGGRYYLRTVGEFMNIAKFERFFRRAAGLDIYKEDLRRYDDFVNQKAYDLLLRGEANANANGRDVIQPSDLPITNGLQESIHAYRLINDEQLDVASILRQLTKLPEIMGGLSFALAPCFKVLYPNLKNPQDPALGDRVSAV